MKTVIQFSTGNVGRHALQMLIERPDLDWWACTPTVRTRSAATPRTCVGWTSLPVCWPPTTSRRWSRWKPTAWSTPPGRTRPQQAIEELPVPAHRRQRRRHLDGLVGRPTPGRPLDARSAGQGLPGRWHVALHQRRRPRVLRRPPGYTALSWPGGPTAVTVSEICDYGTYDDAEFTGVSFGFGTTPITPDPVRSRGVGLDLGRAGPVAGRPPRRRPRRASRAARKPWVATERIECTMMTVPPGHVAAVRFGSRACVDGQPVIAMEHVNRLTAAAAPHWPVSPEGRPGVHRVVVRGNPGWRSTPTSASTGSTTTRGGHLNRGPAVNAIHACAPHRPD